MQAQIGAVCADDPGVGSDVGPYKNAFSSFGKLSLGCRVGANSELTMIKYAHVSGNFLFSIFWNAFGSLPISALCIFDLKKIVELFFGDNRDPEMAWKMKKELCQKRNLSGFPEILDKSDAVANPQISYVFPELAE